MGRNSPCPLRALQTQSGPLAGKPAAPGEVHEIDAVTLAAKLAVAKSVSAIDRTVGAMDRVAAVEIATTSRGFQAAASDPEKWAPETRDTTLERVSDQKHLAI